MSHEVVEAGRAVYYHLPGGFSDLLRTQEFSEFFREYRGACFSVRTQDGWSWSSWPRRAPQFVATFRSREVLDSAVDDASEASLGRVFLNGALDLEGNIFVLLSVAEYALTHSDGMSPGLVQTIARISHGFSRKLLPIHRNSGAPSWHEAPCPLDLPQAFFEPWLGECLGHGCACFDVPGEEMEAAQKNFCESVCRWLELERGDHLLEVGCGWGSLILHAAEKYRANAEGIASCDAQAEVAAQRICRGGQRSRCSVSRRDMRAARRGHEQYEKAADVGTFEQVSAANLADYLACMHDALAPGGLLVLDRLTRAPGSCVLIRSLDADFLSESLSRELHVAETAGFEPVRVESLNRACEDSLRVWIDRLLNPTMCEQTRIFSRAYRCWMLYLVELATCLQAGDVQAHRVLLRRSSAAAPRSRSSAWRVLRPF